MHYIMVISQCYPLADATLVKQNGGNGLWAEQSATHRKNIIVFILTDNEDQTRLLHGSLTKKITEWTIEVNEYIV